MITHGYAKTASADRYFQQMVKDWCPKFARSYADGQGAERMKGAIANLLDQSAFRAASLAFEWGPA
jgi:hypothetical protein